MISPVDDHGVERCTVMIMGAKSAVEMQAKKWLKLKLTIISRVDDCGVEKRTVMVMGAKSATEMQAEEMAETKVDHHI